MAGSETRRTFVESEFAPLRTVVLAQSEFAGSERLSRHDPELAFLGREDLNRLVAMRGKNHGDVFPERQAAWEVERENLATVFTRHGVEVIRPRLLTEDEKTNGRFDGYSNFFVRDPWFTVGGSVIEGSLRLRHRRREVLPSRPILFGRALSTTESYIAAPQPELDGHDGSSGFGPYIEGGDILVLEDHVFVGHSGLASDDRGYAWLSAVLTPRGYTVEQVRLQPDILHLDCALGLVRDGLITVCEEALLEGIPERISTWDRVSVTKTEATALATNGLPLSPEVYMTDPAFAHIGDQLEKRGVTVEYVDFSITRSFGGSFRCSTQPLLRVF